MAKISLTDLANLQNETTAVNAINNNNAAIEAAVENTLSRDGTTPNQMNATLDMNSFQILNLPAPIGADSPLRLQELIDFVGGGTIGGIPTGGTTNQVLAKNSNANFDAGWKNSVTSVGLTAPAELTVTGSPITSTGTIGLSWANTPTGTGPVVKQTSGTLITPTISNPQVDNIRFNGATSGTTNVAGPAVGSSNTVTLPNITDTLVSKTSTDTLTNKTIDTAGPNTIKVNGNTLSATAGTATVTVPNATTTLVGRDTTDTLTNKTIISPIISTSTADQITFNGSSTGATVLKASAAAGGTMTMPNATDTFVGKATTDTLTNKSISGATNTLSNIALSSHSTQNAYTFVGNNTGSAAAPTAVDIATLTTKGTPAASDYVILSDQAASGAWKKATISSIGTSSGVSSIGGQTGAVTVGNGLIGTGGAVNLNTGVFVVNRNGTNQTGLTAATDNKIQFTNELKDANNWFDNVTNFRYTPLVAGTYQIAVSVASSNGTAGETCQAVIFKNGSAYARGGYMGATGAAGYSSVCVAYVVMNGTTDFIEGYAYLPVAVTTLNGATLQTYMSGHRVGD